MKYTKQDVIDAVFANRYRLAALWNPELTAIGWLENDCMDGSSFPEMLAQYERGLKILETAEVMATNDRYDKTSSVAWSMSADKLIRRGANSPIVEFPAGWVATNEMYCVYALKEKAYE